MNLSDQIKKLEEEKTKKESDRDALENEVKTIGKKLKQLRAEQARQEKRLKDILN